MKYCRCSVDYSVNLVLCRRPITRTLKKVCTLLKYLFIVNIKVKLILNWVYAYLKSVLITN